MMVIRSRRTTSFLLAAGVAAALLASACGSAAGSPSASAGATVQTTAPTSAPTTPAATSVPPNAAATTSNPTGAPTSLDPCLLVTGQEASSLAGTAYGVGKEETTSGGGRTCVYGSQTLSVFTVLVGQAPDAATAQADWTQEEAKVEAALQQGLTQLPPGYKVNFSASDVSVSGADRAAVIVASGAFGGVRLDAGFIYLLKGATFVTFGDLAANHAAPSAADLEAQATTTLGRVP